MKISSRARERFQYFALCQDSHRLPPLAEDPAGRSALECFHEHETHGRLPPCREPGLLGRALNGKSFHGITVRAMAEDFVGRLLFASDLESLPEFVRQEVLAQSAKLALRTIGFVPTFIRTGSDCSTLPPPPP